MGLFYLLKDLTPAKLFLGLYFVCTIWFSSMMVRLILVVCPAMCMLSGIGLSEFLNEVMKGFFEKKKVQFEEDL